MWQQDYFLVRESFIVASVLKAKSTSQWKSEQFHQFSWNIVRDWTKKLGASEEKRHIQNPVKNCRRKLGTNK